MDHLIRPGTVDDVDALVSLLPRLADFDVPNDRAAEELWRGDRALLRQWAAGERPDVDVLVAVAAEDHAMLGVSVISTREELLSGEPSAHLEILALEASAEGLGIGSSLVEATERLAASKGLLSLSLHVFAANARARALYERHGFDGEILRYFKRLRPG